MGRQKPDYPDMRPIVAQIGWKNLLKYWLLSLAMVALILLYVLEARYFINTFHSGNLAGKAFLAGALLATITGYFIARLEKGTYDQVRAFLIIAVPIILFSPLLGSLSNRYLDASPVQEASFEIFSVNPVGSPRSLKGNKEVVRDYDLFILLDGQNPEKIRIFEQSTVPQKGDIITLKIKRGFWGYQWIPRK